MKYFLVKKIKTKMEKNSKQARENLLEVGEKLYE